MTPGGLKHYARHAAVDVGWIAFSASSERKWPLFAAELRLRRSDVLSRLRGQPLSPDLGPLRTRVFGFDVHFFDYGTLTYLFGEVFIRELYAFEAGYPQPLIIDAGSNIGLVTLYFKRRYPAARILAFEPEPRTFDLLKRNIAANDLRKVEAFNIALGSERGEARLFRGAGPLLSSTRIDRSHNDDVATVSAGLLSDYIHEPVDFLKIDVEGVERDVLADLDRADKLRFVRQFVCEYHHHIGGENRLGEYLTILERNGFGYELHTKDRPPFRRNRPQDILIFGYQARQTRARDGMSSALTERQQEALIDP